MITLDAIREAWEEASKAADRPKNPAYIRAIFHNCEYLWPTTDDRLAFVRCRVCSSIEAFGVGPEDALPDSNQSFRCKAKSPCGVCRTVVFPCGWNYAGVRAMHSKGQILGLGGHAVPGKVAAEEASDEPALE